jgi:hypothetical protein
MCKPSRIQQLCWHCALFSVTALIPPPPPAPLFCSLRRAPPTCNRIGLGTRIRYIVCDSKFKLGGNSSIFHLNIDTCGNAYGFLDQKVTNYIAKDL